MRAAEVELIADRWTPFTERLEVQGISLAGATLAAAIRMHPDAPGSPLVALAGGVSAGAEGVRLFYAGTDTVANHLAAARLSVVPEDMAGGDSLALTLIDIRVNEATMENSASIPFPGSGAPGERGDDVELHWDMHITPSGGVKQVWFRGPFRVVGGDVQ